MSKTCYFWAEIAKKVEKTLKIILFWPKIAHIFLLTTSFSKKSAKSHLSMYICFKKFRHSWFQKCQSGWVTLSGLEVISSQRFAIRAYFEES